MTIRYLVSSAVGSTTTRTPSPLLLAFTFLALTHLASAFGDILNRTFCLCGTEYTEPDLRTTYPGAIEHGVFVPAVPVEEQAASYVLLEYYDVSDERLYDIEIICRTQYDPNRKKQVTQADCFDFTTTRPQVCKKFDKHPGEWVRKGHLFCYRFNQNKMTKRLPVPRDQYVFDGIFRLVSNYWDIIVEEPDVVEEICTKICAKRFNMPIYTGAKVWYWRSRKDMTYDQEDPPGCWKGGWLCSDETSPRND